MIIRNPHGKKGIPVPDLIQGVERVSSMSILGVTFSSTLSFKEHIDTLAAAASRSMYALRILRSHGQVPPALWDVTRATIVAKMLYASPAWWGFIDSDTSKRRIQAILGRMIKGGFLPHDFPSFELNCVAADKTLFSNVLGNEHHVLYQLLPPVKTVSYSLRPRPHNRIIPRVCHELSRCNFFNRMLCGDIC